MKSKQLCSYYGYLLLKALREYCIGCQKERDLSRTLGTKFYSPFLWLQRPHTSLHSLEMELLCNIQKYQRETSEIPLPTCLAIPLGGKKKVSWRQRKQTKSTLKDYLFLIATGFFYWLPKLPMLLPALCLHLFLDVIGTCHVMITKLWHKPQDLFWVSESRIFARSSLTSCS